MHKASALAVAIAVLLVPSCGEKVATKAGQDTGTATGIVIGAQVPDFTGMSLDGSQTIRLSDVHARRIVITFWASWCLPCAEETKVLKEHYAKTSRSEFEVIGIAYDDAVSDSRRFARDHNIPWTLLQDTDKTIAHAYGIRGVPVAVFIDAKHVVRTQVFGLTSTGRLEEALKS